MAIIINRWTGAAGTETKTDITSANTVANATDAHQATASGSNHPIKVPASGTNYSYWVVTRLNATTAPSGTINNIRWYTDGTNNFGTGVGCNVLTSDAYDQATGTEGETGDELNANYTGTNSGFANAFTYDSTSPLSVSGSTSTSGDFGNFVVYQITADNTAGPGTTTQETFTFVYDET